MKLRRFRIRTLMIFVAVVALAIEVAREIRLASVYRDRALSHGLLETAAASSSSQAHGSLAMAEAVRQTIRRSYESEHEQRMKLFRGRGALEVDSDETYIAFMKRIDRFDDDRIQALTAQYQRWESLRKYHQSLRLKYDRAARNPWLPVDADSSDHR